MGGPGAPGAEETGDFSDGEDDVAANTAAQAAARAAFAEDKVADTFYSSDEDESEDRSSSVTGSFVSASGPSLSEPSKKFRVVIKVWVCMFCLSPLRSSGLPSRYERACLV